MTPEDVGTTEHAAYRILTVDDEPAILRLMEYVLERQGYTVRTAVDGEDALFVATQFRPHLIVLDIMMPRKDGYAVTEAIRANQQLARTPIIMLSAKAQETDIEQGLAVGVDTYLTKPFEPDGLLELVARYLSLDRAAERTVTELPWSEIETKLMESKGK